MPEVYFRLLSTTPLSRLVTAYCDRQQLARASVCFKFNEQVIEDTHTPEALEMVDGDHIDAYWIPALQAERRRQRLQRLRPRGQSAGGGG